MSKKNIIIVTITIFIFIGALAIFLYANSINSSNNKEKNITNTTNNQNDKSSQNTNEFYFYDLDENKFNLNNFSDKPIVMLFWKSDNSKSYDMINLITKYYEEYKDKVNFLAINVNEPDIDLELVDNIKAAGFTIPIYLDTNLTSYEEYYYEKLPYIIFIEEDGTIGKEVAETISEDSFTANLDLISKNY